MLEEPDEHRFLRVSDLACVHLCTHFVYSSTDELNKDVMVNPFEIR